MLGNTVKDIPTGLINFEVLLSGNISSSAVASFCESLCQARKEHFKMVNVICFSNANIGEEGTKAIVFIFNTCLYDHYFFLRRK